MNCASNSSILTGYIRRASLPAAMLRSTTLVPAPSRSPSRPTWKASARGSEGRNADNHPRRENDGRWIWMMARRQVGPGQAGSSGVCASARCRARDKLRVRTEAGPRWGPRRPGATGLWPLSLFPHSCPFLLLSSNTWLVASSSGPTHRTASSHNNSAIIIITIMNFILCAAKRSLCLYIFFSSYFYYIGSIYLYILY